MTRCSWGVRLVGIASLAVCLAAAAAPPPSPPRVSPEPTREALEPVQPEWEARGWKAVVPHAYVLKKLLPALEKPEAGAAPVFWLKGGTRVPVLVQGQEWWKISWTEGRTGWVRARDVEPHASFILIDTQTGKVQKRLAAKGQLGAVSDGKSLWSIANTGITRTVLDERPVFWSRLAAADRDASLPEGSYWTPDRTHFYVRARKGDEGPLLRTDVTTGGIETAGTPPPGGIVGGTPEGRLLIVNDTGDRQRTHLYDPGAGRTVRTVPTIAQAVTRSGISFHKREQELLRVGTDLRITRRVRLRADVEALFLSPDDQFIAASCKSSSSRSVDPRYEVHVYRADTLRPVITLQLPAGNDSPYLYRVVFSPNGWWLVGEGGEMGTSAHHFNRSGKLLSTVDGSSPTTVSDDGKQIYLLGDGEVIAIATETGRRRTFPLSWRRELPAAFLPRPSEPGFPTHPQISSLTLSPDGRMLIVAEWLSGDPDG